MPQERQPVVYILTNGDNGTLYVGVTSNLPQRLAQHRAGTSGSFTKRHALHRLVYYEAHETMLAAIAREKQLKRYRRDWKRNLIERDNPAWNDLSAALAL